MCNFLLCCSRYAKTNLKNDEKDCYFLTDVAEKIELCNFVEGKLTLGHIELCLSAEVGPTDP